MSISIWSNQNPLDATIFSTDHMAALVMKHEQQIKDLAAHLLELKQLVTPMMEFKRREWVGLTENEATELWEKIDDRDSWELLKQVEKKLKEKNA
jgi:hypothetical protein